MITKKLFQKITMLVGFLSVAAFSRVGLAADNAAQTDSSKISSREMKKDMKSASQQLSDSLQVVQKMESEPKLKPLMNQATGIFIVPKYGRAGLGFGGQGGEGVVLFKQGNSWTDPAFYNMGGISAGLQAGVEGGSIAFIMNNEKAVQEFKKNNNFSLDANAGYTIINASAKAEGDLSKADLVAWSNTKGLFGGANIGLKDIKFDKDENAAFYGKNVSLNDISSGKVKAPEVQHVAALKKALLGFNEKMSGGSQEQNTDSNK